MQYILLGIYYFLVIYQYTMILYVLLTWFPNMRSHPIFRLLGVLVEPYLSRFRRIIPPIGMIDISPLIGFFLIRVAIMGFGNLLVSGSF